MSGTVIDRDPDVRSAIVRALTHLGQRQVPGSLRWHVEDVASRHAVVHVLLILQRRGSEEDDAVLTVNVDSFTRNWTIDAVGPTGEVIEIVHDMPTELAGVAIRDEDSAYWLVSVIADGLLRRMLEAVGVEGA